MARGLVRKLDWPLVLIYLLLVVLGWLNIYAAVYSEAHSSIFDVSQRYGQQLVWILAAFVLALVLLLIDSRVYYVFAYYVYGFVLLVLLLVLLFGTEVHSSRSWLVIGPLRVQPSEFAKFATSLALARFMGHFRFRSSSWRSWLGAFLILALPVGLILLQNDFGSAMVFGVFALVFYREGMPGGVLLFLAFLVLLFLASLLFDRVYILLGLLLLFLLLYVVLQRDVKGGVRFGGVLLVVTGLLFLLNEWFGLGFSLYSICLVPVAGCVLVGLLYGLWKRKVAVWLLALMLGFSALASFGENYVFNYILDTHHQRRINDLLGIEDDPLGWGYNVNQSKIAIGSGGLGGKGFLEGTQTKYNFVPEQSTDFIFCTVGEEWGFVGGTVVVLLFLLLLIRVVQVAERQREAFHRIYGYCVASVLFVHFAVNVSMTIGLFPVVGIPLPFFSYGGSSLWAFTMLLFVLVKFDSTRLR